MMKLNQSMSEVLREMRFGLPEDVNIRKSRLGGTIERLGFQYRTQIGRTPIRKNFNTKLAVAEGLSVISGHFDERIYEEIATLKAEYTVHQSYGHKIFTQLPRVLKQLALNPGTRRALLHVGQPMDGQEEEKPCIQTFQFIQDNHTLHMNLWARSWDLLLGLPYDLAVASMLGLFVSDVLGLTPGQLIATAGSGHIYLDLVEQFDPYNPVAWGWLNLHYSPPNPRDLFSWKNTEQLARRNQLALMDSLVSRQFYNYFIPKKEWPK